MTCSRKESVWPFLCILACLFVLSVAAPRAWDRASQQRTATELAIAAATAELEAEGEAPLPAVAPVIVPAAPASSGPAAGLVAVEPAPKIASGDLSLHQLSDPGADDRYDEDDVESGNDWTSDDRPPLETAEEPRPAIPTPTNVLRPAIEVAVLTPATRPGAKDVAPQPPRADRTEEPKKIEAPQSPGAEMLHQVQRLPQPDQRPAAAAPQAVVQPTWRCPDSLRRRLDKLKSEKTAAGWAERAQMLLDGLQAASADGDDALLRALTAVERHVGEAEPLAEHRLGPRAATELRRAGHAIGRRVAVWTQAVSAAGPGLAPGVATRIDPRPLTVCLANLDLLHDDSREARAWQSFLLLDQFAAAVARREAGERELHRLARTALTRLAMPMSPEQREVVAGAPLAALTAELRRWAVEPVDLGQTLEAVERFEQTGLPSEARRIADDCRRLSYSPRPAERAMGERLETLYRNANLRIALSQALLNRMAPAREPEYEPVRDTILGLPVRGRSVNSSALAVRFIPDPQRLLMSFEVQGDVTAATSSDAGPAVFFHDSYTQYIARKPLEIEAQGVRLGETEVDVENNTRLRGLRTKFDIFPIIGPLMREVARSQHEQQRGAANQEAEWKVMNRARERIDAESYQQLDAAVGQMRERLFTPLADLSLMPSLIGGQTTAERMTMRWRLAAEPQLGSDTPRPRAPSDSLASMQIHETAINNLLEQLNLNGRRMSLPELVAHVSSKLHRPTAWKVDSAHDDVAITFAARDAVYVRCTENQLTLSLSIVELCAAGRCWPNFQVRVCYRPQAAGRTAELVRDGVVQLAGRLSTGSQIAVRGVFSKIFPKDSAFRLTPEWLLNDDRLHDLSLTQFVVDDGWMGLALGPSAPAKGAKGEVAKGAGRSERKDRFGWRSKSTAPAAR